MMPVSTVPRSVTPTGRARLRVAASMAAILDNAARTSKDSSTVCPNRLIRTSHGPLEYAVIGEGLPLVVMHGSGGGVRQGLVMRYLLDTRRIQIIALSRPGYWGTPLETAPEIEQQADRVVELLDALKIETAAVLGHSAGGPPAAHFALRHPERCLGLVLLSAMLPPPNAMLAGMIKSMPVVFRVLDFSDWPLRVFIALVCRVLLPLMGLLNIRRLAQVEARRMISEVFEGMIPFGAWRAGTLNDHLRLGKAPLAFEACRVPTLIVHGTADPGASYERARAAADAVSGAKVMIIEGGSHGIFVTHYQEVGAEIEAFLLSLKS
jgi:2-hydroxy-6-oxonona-2,4-dienedioate hydrolase